MTDDLTQLPPETFFRLAIERGGLDLDEVTGDLSPDAADALRLIAQGAPGLLSGEPMRDTEKAAPTRAPMRSLGMGRDPESEPKPRARRCPACDYVPRPGDRYCRQCGQRLDEPPAAVSLADLVAEGRLTTEQANEVERTIVDFQRNYPAGTRYSVFGGPQ
jgi:hypothetical protein